MRLISTIVRLIFLALFFFLLINGKVMLWLALFGISLIVALLFGRIYCGYICPMNTLMGPIEWLSKKLKLQTSRQPKWLRNGYFTWIALFVSVVTMLLSKKLLHMELPILPFWLVIAVLVTLRYQPAVFHNLICPFGSLQRTFGRFARLSKKVDKTTCVGCKLCEKDCPSNAIKVAEEDKKAVVNTALCHQCSNCQGACPKSAIHYTRM